jgi:hypothetical protein
MFAFDDIVVRIGYVCVDIGIVCDAIATKGKSGMELVEDEVKSIGEQSDCGTLDSI